MLVRTLRETTGTEREVNSENWYSRRLLLKGDRMGFSLHDTVIRAGTSTRMKYANHLEAVYCIAGSGSVQLVATGEIFPIEAGTVYALDEHDDHILTAESEMRMICVFNPPVVGPEVHDENGVYPRLEEAVETASG
jgi:L-ectoine synthase